MFKLTAKSPLSAFSAVATKLDLEVCPSVIGYELWRGSRYKGSFPSLDLLAAELNTHHEIYELKSEEHAQRQEIARAALIEKEKEELDPVRRASKRLENARPAAVIINGNVVGLCTTLAKRGGTIKKAVLVNGKVMRTEECAVSFSTKNLAKAHDLNIHYQAFEYDDEIYYTSIDTDE